METNSNGTLLEREVNNSESIRVERESIGESCIKATSVNGDPWMLTIGDKIISRKRFETVEEAIEYAEQKPWELIEIAIAIFTENAVTNHIKNMNNER